MKKDEDEKDVESQGVSESQTSIQTSSAQNSPTKVTSQSSSRLSPRNENSRIRHVLPMGGARKGIGKTEWARQIDFPLAGNAIAVDLTNIAQISYLVYKHGGIAFFIPCLFFIGTCAFPLLYMENIIGQSTREGLITMWKIVPLAKGVGYSIQIIFITLMMYYLTPATWAVIYLMDSLQSSPPWTRCDNPWNSASCQEFNVSSTCARDFDDATTAAPTPEMEMPMPALEIVERNYTSSSSEYLRGRVLRLYKSPFSNPEDFPTDEQKYQFHRNATGITPMEYGLASELGIGSPIVDLTLCLIVFYIIIYIFLYKGIRWIGYLARVTVPLPILILLFLLIRGAFIKGAWKGITELLSPNFEVLSNVEVWVDGAAQVFFSLGAGLGSHLTLAGHNKFRQNVWRDSWLVLAGNTTASLVAVMVMSVYIGHCAFVRNLSCLEYIAKFQRWDFIYLVMSDASSTIKYGNFGAFLFFTMIAVIVLDTTIIMMHILSQAIGDDIRFQFPNPRQAANVIQFSLVGFAFVVNIFSLTKGGLWLYQFFDSYAIALPMTVAISVQIIAIGWIWGLEELSEAAQDTTGRVPGFYLQMCWKYISPLCFTIVVVFLALDDDPLQVEGKEVPEGWHIFGSVVKFSAAFCIPGYVLYRLLSDRPEDISPFKTFLLLFWPQEEHQMWIDTGIHNRLTFSHLFFSERQFCQRTKRVKVEPERKDSPKSLVNVTVTGGAPEEEFDTSASTGPVQIKYSTATVFESEQLDYEPSGETGSEAVLQKTADAFRNEVEGMSVGTSGSSFSSVSSKSSKKTKKKQQKGAVSRKNKLLGIGKEKSISVFSRGSTAYSRSIAGKKTLSEPRVRITSKKNKTK